MTYSDDNLSIQPKVQIPAAQYLRMSTERQQYSIVNQAAAIQRYAVERGYSIVATYSDDGRSGVTIGGRTGLLRLIDDVETGQCPFAAILVYDVSRWGRFQNPDEAALYEVRCRCAGVPVHYVAEPFDNDGSVLSSLMKTLKRAMAAEYSRELSAKVTQGHLRMLERGYHQGGFPCFGLQRVLIDGDGQRKQILRFGERKNLQSDRVILEPGPPEQVAIVNEVYRRYLAGEQQVSLVSLLNDRGDLQANGRPWTIGAMHRMLTSECYIGNIVWGKQDGKLGRSRRPVTKPKWIRHEAVFAHVVEPLLFGQVQTEMAWRKSRRSRDDVLAGLRKLLKKHGTLNKQMIDRAKGVASTPTIARRFGSLKAAYALIGFLPVPNNKYTKINRRISEISGRLGKRFARLIGPASFQHNEAACVLKGDGFRVVVLLARCIDRMAGPTQWFVDWSTLDQATVAVIGLMDSRNNKVSAYHVVPGPAIEMLQERKSRDDGRCLQPFVQPKFTACVALVESHTALRGPVSPTKSD